MGDDQDLLMDVIERTFADTGRGKEETREILEAARDRIEELLAVLGEKPKREPPGGNPGAGSAAR
jgi:hypothetical protein